MRCSVSPFSRASAVCTLMQVAQPLIWEERIFTNSMRLGSRLDSTACDMFIQLFISDGAAAKRSSLAVMVQFPFGVWFLSATLCFLFCEIETYRSRASRDSADCRDAIHALGAAARV